MSQVGGHASPVDLAAASRDGRRLLSRARVGVVSAAAAAAVLVFGIGFGGRAAIHGDGSPDPPAPSSIPATESGPPGDTSPDSTQPTETTEPGPIGGEPVPGELPNGQVTTTTTTPSVID